MGSGVISRFYKHAVTNITEDKTNNPSYGIITRYPIDPSQLRVLGEAEEVSEAELYFYTSLPSVIQNQEDLNLRFGEFYRGGDALRPYIHVNSQLDPVNPIILKKLTTVQSFYTFTVVDQSGEGYYEHMYGTTNSKLYYSNEFKYKIDTSKTFNSLPLCIDNNFSVELILRNAIDYGDTKIQDWTPVPLQPCTSLYSLPGYNADEIVRTFKIRANASNYNCSVQGEVKTALTKPGTIFTGIMYYNLLYPYQNDLTCRFEKYAHFAEFAKLLTSGYVYGLERKELFTDAQIGRAHV